MIKRKSFIADKKGICAGNNGCTVGTARELLFGRKRTDSDADFDSGRGSHGVESIASSLLLGALEEQMVLVLFSEKRLLSMALE